MGYRKVSLAAGCLYHVFSRSIAGFEIFRASCDYQRMRRAMGFYRFSQSVASGGLSQVVKQGSASPTSEVTAAQRVKIIAYCMMPTHVHLLLHQITDRGISEFMRLFLNSYARYFNLRINRKGPLWESRFRACLVETDEYALHLTRYIHLNPSSAGLVREPWDWEHSSYREYLGEPQAEPLCEFEKVINVKQDDYRKFAEDRADYQRNLQRIKSCALD